MNTQVFPHFKAEASCASALNPDLWFPEEVAGTTVPHWSRVPSAMMARAICKGCPALAECDEYSMQYSDLAGIWAGRDRMERTAIQEALNLETISVRSTLLSTIRDYEGRGDYE
jgi:hypothetical protein